MQSSCADIVRYQMLESAAVQVLKSTTMSNEELAMLQGGPLVRTLGCS